MHCQFIVAQGVAPIWSRSCRDQAIDEMRVRVVREIPVGHLVIGRELFLQIEPIKRLPRPAQLDLHDEVLACAHQAERLVRRRLLDVRLQQQGSAQRQDSKAHVSDVAPPLQINAQQHVTSRGDRTFRCAPQNARRQPSDLKADAAEHEYQTLSEDQVKHI